MNKFDLAPCVTSGDGSEKNPYTSEDGSAGISEALGKLCERGGVLRLPSGRYDIYKTITVDTPSLCIDGGIWACNTDPNGVFESRFGTKIRVNGNGYPAIKMGKSCDPISGTVIRNIGVQGDIVGMDTRKLFDFNKPDSCAGLCLTQLFVTRGK